MNPAQHLLCWTLRVYRGVVSPALTVVFGPMGWGCRYTPTCSQYALEAVRTQGAWRGSWLAVRRLLRCHPWGGWGHDPVPSLDRTPCLGFFSSSASQRSCAGSGPSSEAGCSHHSIHSVTSH